MKKRIIEKLRSRAGASITFALLLFLVCTVLCSVIITASTASSGRMSRIAETDQRYYAVTSAAELLKSILDGETVSIVKVVKTTYETVYTSGIAGTPSQVGEAAEAVYLVSGKKAGEISEAADLTSENEADAAAIDSIAVDAAKNISESQTLTSRKLELASTVYGDAGLDFDALAVTIEENLDANGKITLTIYNKYKAEETESSEGDRYTMVLSFGADKSEVASTKTENLSSAASSSTVYTLTTQTTETTITTLTWKLSGIKTNA